MTCRQRLASAVSVAAIGLAATRAETQAVSLSQTGASAHVVLYAQDRSSNVQAVERELRAVARSLGASSLPRIQLFLYEHAADIAAATGVYAGGVTFPGLGQIHSTSYRLRHELVHAVAGGLGGDPGAFFQEGLAVAVGDGGRHNDGRRVDDVARASVRGGAMGDVIARFNSTDADESYAIAGSFMRFLLKRHGSGRVMRFFRDSGTRGPDQSYRDAFGESLEATGALWLEGLGLPAPPKPLAILRRSEPRGAPAP